MSRIGKRPVPVPSGVEVTIDDRTVTVKGPKGTLHRTISEPITVRQEDGQLLVERPDDERTSMELHGLSRSLLNNMVLGVSEGFSRKLEIEGVGYRVVPKGPSTIELSLGYSHSITFQAPEGVTFDVENATRFSVSGIDKQQVGQVAANIRKLRKPEPYKGKGVRYEGERIRRKLGKAGK